MRPFLLLALAAGFVSGVARCQMPSARHASPPPQPARPTHSASTPFTLPVTRIALYKNGVGFFEHAGLVTGDQAVTLDLTSAQLDDVLQSLTAVDLGGGRITGASYNSTTPFEQQIRALPLSLGQQPTQQDLYQSLRGARVEVTGSAQTFSGRILSLEVRPGLVPDEDSSRVPRPTAERRILTVVSDSGAARSLELTGSTTVRILDAPLRADLNTYLELLDRSRSDSVRHLTLTDRGSGSRTLRVSFLSEVPIWKSTYRILLTDPSAAAGAPGSPETGTLQGFSVIDNTTGEDWKEVRLSLIAGSPQSFLQPLAQPIYARRPEIPIAQDIQRTPQTHESGIQMIKEDGPPPVAGMAGMAGMGTASGVAGGVIGGLGASPSALELGKGLHAPSKLPRSGPTVVSPMQPYETVAANSTAPDTTSSAADDLFSYNLTEPVTIPRNGSALVPVLQVRLPSERVTLWSLAQPVAVRALWITNASALTLDRGSFSLVENGAFAGEGLLETIHPGERRLLSYAADQAVHVSVDHRNDSRQITNISISNGVLRATSAEIAEVEYVIHNAAPEARTVLIEQPRRAGWELAPDAKPTETAPFAYRFRVAAGSRETVRLHIGERHNLDQYFRLVDSTDEQLSLFLRNAKASPALLSQLAPVLSAKQAVASLDRQLADKQDNVTQLVEDQKRLRDNLASLKGGTEERSLAKRYTAELNTQEDTLASLRRTVEDLKQQRQTAETTLNRSIETLSVQENLGG